MIIEEYIITLTRLSPHSMSTYTAKNVGVYIKVHSYALSVLSDRKKAARETKNHFQEGKNLLKKISHNACE